ncbi:alpha/beta hydrolase [Actinophytocola oryzae]|uniref:Pimeloyl-ACP methyl ester carboxylesterase n=1 Tax=Actinophytocola oryzae TaxID=502181 RepID=A0A4R7UPR4_9PSEU|nr:alpha/beta fold hydrolase [Actinophytocola oryzae]TDV35915.1 pimeloyl-ACP methyl ester carboxylesterase [Actinophytocola oryzae]
MARRASAAVLTLAGLLLSAPSATAEPVSCSDVTIPVSLAGKQESMYGRLCEPSGPTSTVFLLVPGSSYNSSYWDLPASLGLSSFRAGMNESGYATLTVDRLGTGRSSRPVSLSLTALTQADTLHQVVGRLRAGSVGRAYQKVVIGGHSLGGATSVLEAATFHDVDGVLVAGLAHNIYPAGAVDVVAALYPAALDPVLANRNYDVGYLTTRPGTRGQAFHKPAQLRPAAAAFEESTKDGFAATEAPDALGLGILTPYSALIDVPVLLAMSGKDPLFCSPIPLVGTNCTSSATLRAQEAPYYSASARLRTYVLPGIYGHSFNYAPNARLFSEATAAWADELVGR